MPIFKVAVMIVWLSNADGSIVAHASGIAVDVPTCQRLAAERIAAESGNPELADSTARVSCWNTGHEVPAARRRQVPGSVEL